MACQLLLIRHADIALRYAGRFVGSADVPLEPRGFEQAEMLARLVRSKRAERCFTSPLLRAHQTARVICQSADLPIEVDEDLREIDFGQWEGKTFGEIAAQNPEAANRWAEFPDDFAFPAGESMFSFLARIRRAADRLAREPSRIVLAVTHGGVIRAMICHFLGLHPRNYLLFDVGRATCTTIRLLDGKGVLSGLNEQRVPERS
jgi:alpha-ribazole phosphatase